MDEDLDTWWAEAESACARIISASGLPAGVKLLGPFPIVGMPRTYQAEVWDVDGRRYEYLGLGDSPVRALQVLTHNLRDVPAPEPASMVAKPPD